MDFGQNLFDWLSGNMQPIVLLAIVVSGAILIWKREFSKLIGWAICGVIAVGLVFAPSSAKDFMLQIFNKIIGG